MLVCPQTFHADPGCRKSFLLAAFEKHDDGSKLYFDPHTPANLIKHVVSNNHFLHLSIAPTDCESAEFVPPVYQATYAVKDATVSV